MNGNNALPHYSLHMLLVPNRPTGRLRVNAAEGSQRRLPVIEARRLDSVLSRDVSPIRDAGRP